MATFFDQSEMALLIKCKEEIMRGMGVKFLVSVVLILTTASLSSAQVTVGLGPGNEGITSFNYSIQALGNVEGVGTNVYRINLYETYTNNGYGIVQINGLTQGQNYIVMKYLYNYTGTTWTSFSNELLDPGVDANDVAIPSWVPSGYSRSTDADGLSFAQGTTAITRTSNFFNSYVANELGGIDYIDFYNGSVPNAAADVMIFGLRDNSTSANEPFLLAEKPNGRTTTATPEPVTMLLLGFGIAGLAGVRRFGK